MAFRFNGNYWRDVGTLDAYYEANMDLLGEDPQFHLGRTPMAARGGFDESAAVSARSIIAHGVNAPSGSVFRSVLSSEVRVERGAAVRDSILMKGVHIGRAAKVRRAIIEEQVRIPDGVHVGYDTDEDRRRFVVTSGGIVVVRSYPSEHEKPLPDDPVRVGRTSYVEPFSDQRPARLHGT